MGFYSVKFILLLGFIIHVCSKLTDNANELDDAESVRGQSRTSAVTKTQSQNSTISSIQTVTTTPKHVQGVSRILSSLILTLTEATGKRLVMFDDIGDDTVEEVISLTKESSAGYCERSDTTMRCKLSDNNILVQIDIVIPHMYVSVNLDPNSAVTPLEDITDFCQRKISCPVCPPNNCSIKPTTCPTTTSPTTTCPKTTCPTKPTVTCQTCRTKCLTKPVTNELCKTQCIGSTTERPVPTRTTTNSQDSLCDLNEQETQPTECDGLLLIIFTSIVSFIAGVGVCLLALCLIGHFRGRLCLNFANSSKDVEETGMSPDGTTYTSPQLKTKGETNNKEHEYLDLQSVESQYPTAARTPDGLNKQTGTAQLPTYETTTHDTDVHVYNGLEGSGSHTTNLYDQTSPNRSSEHVYSGIQDDRKPNGPSALQQKDAPVNAQVVQPQPHANLELKPNLDNQGLDMDENMTQQNDYFILMKEDHSNNDMKLEVDTQHDDAENSDDNEDYHSYHTLERI